MKIAIIFFQLGIGGIQRKTVDLINILTHQKKVKEVHVILNTRENFNMIPLLNQKKLRLHIKQESILCPKKIPFWFFINTMLLKTHPDSTLAFLDYCSIASLHYAKYKPGKPPRIILCEDGLTSAYTNYHQDPLRQWLIRRHYPSADRIICPSRAIRNQLIRKYKIPIEKLVIIPNWSSVGKPNKIKGKKYDVIFAGRFEHQKNVSYILKAFRDINNVLPFATLVMVGEGSQKPRLLKLARFLNIRHNVSFRSSTNRINRIIQQSRIMLLSSRYEGMPVVALESLALGTPIVTTNFIGVKDFIRHGENGFICHSKKEMISYALQLLQHNKLRKHMALKAIARAQKDFSRKHAFRYAQMLTNSDGK
ncbi:MAG: hypothetical protein A2785_02620 [Candidatus Chisholmbacteria bacterium RIFCSPHIGHO2_01_FULL_49_18]|uniref:Glycosyl transferase family 1 domain-containing protein n=1 Tax=Candidatus Chisholmbacteria bacterium RIFCSPHIGHO2_01_FULL_49_18 TaxID=1797590 RepID=A0A1G1VKW6_9BACT|nr:MAG: hypothetical protein A2785_02620 [Candidatus Chisholmbacteria bacterium RIFCSPHIGHO2_01_FULL_49_18]